MSKPVEKIDYFGRQVSRFIPYPKQVRDGTWRCICCGQIDEEGFHDPALCGALAKPDAEPPAVADAAEVGR